MSAPPTQPTADELRAELTTALGNVVASANVFGRGPNASVDVIFEDGRKVTFERFSDIAKPAALSAHLVTYTGTYRTFKGAEAGAVAAAIYNLAKHHAEGDQDEAVREFGVEYMRIAPVLAVNMGDQADRWRAFSALAVMNPAADCGEDRSAWALATCSTVLADKSTGKRLVRAGWFQSYVKREVGGLYSPAALSIQMQRVGWTRPGTQGRVKAKNPTDGRELVWTFYVVEPGWETGQVNASESSYACAGAHARGVDTPAFTRSPEGATA